MELPSRNFSPPSCKFIASEVGSHWRGRFSDSHTTEGKPASIVTGGMSASKRSMTSAASELHPDIMVQYLRSLGVTPETTNAIRDEVCSLTSGQKGFSLQLSIRSTIALKCGCYSRGGHRYIICESHSHAVEFMDVPCAASEPRVALLSSLKRVLCQLKEETIYFGRENAAERSSCLKLTRYLVPSTSDPSRVSATSVMHGHNIDLRYIKTETAFVVVLGSVMVIDLLRSAIPYSTRLHLKLYRAHRAIRVPWT